MRQVETIAIVTLTNRQLNRTTRARQGLLERCEAGPVAVVELCRGCGGRSAKALAKSRGRGLGGRHDALMDLVVARRLVRSTSLRSLAAAAYRC